MVQVKQHLQYTTLSLRASAYLEGGGRNSKRRSRMQSSLPGLAALTWRLSPCNSHEWEKATLKMITAFEVCPRCCQRKVCLNGMHQLSHSWHRFQPQPRRVYSRFLPAAAKACMQPSVGSGMPHGRTARSACLTSSGDSVSRRGVLFTSAFAPFRLFFFAFRFMSLADPDASFRSPPLSLVDDDAIIPTSRATWHAVRVESPVTMLTKQPALP